MSLNPGHVNTVLLDEVRQLCSDVEKKTVGGMSLYCSKEDRDEARFFLEGEKSLALKILGMIGK